jgi:hypothetical protein
MEVPKNFARTHRRIVGIKENYNYSDVHEYLFDWYLDQYNENIPVTTN